VSTPAPAPAGALYPGAHNPTPGQTDLLAAAAAGVLEVARMTWQVEAELQAEIARVLEEAGLAFDREVRLGDRARIDFLSAAGVGIEVKTRGSAPAVTRQLQRYAHSDRVHHLLLATTRPHLASLPSTLAGVGLTVTVLAGGAW
jgi:hypothetical protein